MKKALAVVALCSVPVLASAQTPLEQAIARSERQVAQGRPEEAVRTLTRAAEQTGSAGLLALGRLHERLGDLDAAASAYDRAVSSAAGTTKAEALATQTALLLRRGQATDALDLARRAVDAQPSANALAALARAQARLQQCAEALATAERAVAADPASGMAQLAHGEALLALRRPSEAEAPLRRAVERLPGSALAGSRLAVGLLALGRGPEALAVARRTSEADARNGEALGVLGLALVAVDAQANWGDAIAAAQTAATTYDPGNPLVHTAVGRLFEVSGRVEQAVEEYRAALAREPAYAPAQVALARAETALGRADGLYAPLRADLAAGRPVDAEVFRALGEDALRRRRLGDAVEWLQRATAQQGADAEGFGLLGRALHAQGRYADAAAALRRAVELQPANLEYRSSYGLALGQSGDLDAALAELSALTAGPGAQHAGAWANLGWAYRTAGKPEEAIVAYAKALERDPAQGQAAIGLGWAQLSCKRYELATKAYENAIAIDPGSAGLAHAGLGWAHGLRRDPEQARVHVTAARAAGVDDAQLEAFVARLEALRAKGQLPTEAEIRDAEDRWRAEQDRQRRIEIELARAQSSDAAVRVSAMTKLASLAGADALDVLICRMQEDSDYGVRIAATREIGSLGPRARRALPHIDGILRQDPYDPGLDATPEQLVRQTQDHDYRRALAIARERIGGARAMNR